MHGKFSDKAGLLVRLGGALGWGVSTLAGTAMAQDPALAAPSLAAPSPAAPASTAESHAVDIGPNPSTPEREFTPGFEAGLRLGIGLPVGNAGKGPLGEQRKIGDLLTWRSPVWVDVAYRVSPVASYGLYGQIGVGGAGDLCAGKCDWSDLRLGVQGKWRLNPGDAVDPWLGLGVGIESLSFQTMTLQPVEDEAAAPFWARTTERLMGPELLLQGGLGLRVEDSLQLGPYLAASVGSYLGDHYECQLEPCPGGSSINGSGFHAWIGVGLNGSYSP